MATKTHGSDHVGVKEQANPLVDGADDGKAAKKYCIQGSVVGSKAISGEWQWAVESVEGGR